MVRHFNISLPTKTRLNIDNSIPAVAIALFVVRLSKIDGNEVTWRQFVLHAARLRTDSLEGSKTFEYLQFQLRLGVLPQYAPSSPPFPGERYKLEEEAGRVAA